MDLLYISRLEIGRANFEEYLTTLSGQSLLGIFFE